MSFDALFDGSDANLLPDDFETFWHSQPFGWAACDAMTLAKKVWAAAVTTEREACAKICDIADRLNQPACCAAADIRARSNV